MTRTARVLFLTLVAFLALPLGYAGATAPRVPLSLYPSGAHVSYRASLSNRAMDCMWGFFCEGNVPVFHTLTQTELQRRSGWAQFAGVTVRGQITMSFQLFASRYSRGVSPDGKLWGATALGDLASALHDQGYVALSHPSIVLPAGHEGRWLIELQRNGRIDLVVMAAWTGQTEIEALALFNHRSRSARATATSLLRLQLQRALSVSRRL